LTLDANSADISNFLELAGTIAFAVSGAMLAVRSRLDWLGAVVLAVVAAVGGGTIRDLLLGLTPVSWIAEPWPIFVAIATAAVVIASASRVGVMLESSKAVSVSDAAGLAVFAVTGTDIALAAGVSPVIAIMIGAISGTGGGVMRDVLVGRVPLVLSGEIYAVAALAGAAIYALLFELGLDTAFVWWIPILVTFGLRIVAMRRDWALPTLGLDEQPGPAGAELDRTDDGNR
jgi:uncharacterized membrane protein YeiH